MAVDKLVDSTQLDSDLTSVANAIRTRGGTSADLAFPAGFVSAVGAIGNQYSAADEGKVVNNGALVAQGSDTVTQNGTVDTTLINSLTVNVSGGDPNENLNKLASASLVSWNAKGLTYLNRISFIVGLKTVVFPDLSRIRYANGNNLSQNADLETVDCGPSWPSLPANCFNNCSILGTLILRPTTVVMLRNINCFGNTRFKSGGSGGTIYIPKALYDHLGDGTSDDYKAASNWSTVEGYGTITWAKIEGSQYENYYADGTPIPTT